MRETFPKARFDIDEAGKCYAFGLYTACVFHLMRIVDLCLKRLGAHYGIIAKNPNWNEYLRPLREQYDKLKNTNPEEAQTLSDILERFSSYRAVRNPLTHSDELLPDDSSHRIESKYTPEEARRHFDNANAFMTSLADFLSNNRKREDDIA
ncbi:MAG: HEPN domain-containing protein [candidate division Zixibacteria bacterium]|nr:HEPN domain-containing protein [candidate division Zixibacteria bacterium]